MTTVKNFVGCISADLIKECSLSGADIGQSWAPAIIEQAQRDGKLIVAFALPSESSMALIAAIEQVIQGGIAMPAPLLTDAEAAILAKALFSHVMGSYPASFEMLGNLATKLCIPNHFVNAAKEWANVMAKIPAIPGDNSMPY